MIYMMYIAFAEPLLYIITIINRFTTGYGDITAHNTTEQWVCSVCILTGSCFFGMF